MAQTIKLKRSGVQGGIPTTSQLELGEIALNTYDGKLFIKKDDGVETIVEIGGGGGGSELVLNTFTYTATSEQTTFTGEDDNTNILSYGSNLFHVYLNGILLDASDYGATDGTSIVLGTGAVSGDILTIHTYSAEVVTLVLDTFTYTATSEQTTFTGEDNNTNTLSYSSSFFHVYLNGVLLDDSDYTATDGTSIVLGTGVASGDILTIHTYSADVITLGATANSVGILELDVSDGTSGQVLTTDGAGNLSFTSSSGGISTGKAIAMAIVFG